MNTEFEEIAAHQWNTWKQQREMLRDQGAGLTFGQLPGFEKAFLENAGHRTVLCIDEGCTGTGVHLAGSGCGLAEEELLEQLAAAQITEFTTHEGCGAWALARPTIQEANVRETLVIEWGRNVANKLHVPYRHISAAEMNRPQQLHNAFYAIYDCTGAFDRDAIPEMGPGFVTSPRYFATAKDNMELALHIAFGAHGFGERFNEENPFVLVGIADPANADFTEERILAELTEIKDRFPGGRVKIDVTTAPQTK